MVLTTLALAGIAILWSTASVLLIVILATSVYLTHNASTLVVISAAIQILSYLGLLAVIAIQCRLSNRSVSRFRTFLNHWKHPIFLCLGVVPLAVATALVGTTLGLILGTRTEQNVLPLLGRSTHIFYNSTCVVWGIAILIQAGYLVGFFWSSTGKSNRLALRSSVKKLNPSMIKYGDTSTMATERSKPFLKPAASLPSLAASAMEIPPKTSLSRLVEPSLTRETLAETDTIHALWTNLSETPSDRPPEDGGFDSWETSAVSFQIREAILQSKPCSKLSELEPIPGSRSPSPATALEGPFSQNNVHHMCLQQPPVPMETNAITDHPEPTKCSAPHPSVVSARKLDPCSKRTLPQPKVASKSVLSRSRASSTSRTCSISSEDHIHPLFRTGSPTPPPSPSIRTVVHAAPEAGQFISEGMLIKMRSASMSSNCSPLIRSESVPNFRSPNLNSVNSRPPPVPLKSERRSISHHRKRSASFETGIDGLVALHGRE